MLQPTPESDGLVIQRSLTRPVQWVGWIRWLAEILRGAPKLSLLVLTVAVICAIFAPELAPYDPVKGDLARMLTPPSLSNHLLGTDHLGRDILSRLIYGA